MSPAKLTRFFLRQPASFWCICIYIFFEYVRPQQIYLWLPQIPYNKIALVATAVFAVAEGKKIRWGMVETLLMVFLAACNGQTAGTVGATQASDSIVTLANYGVTGVFVFIASAMILVFLIIAIFGPSTTGRRLEEIAH